MAELKTWFDNYDNDWFRPQAQEKLSEEGFYSGLIDGRWGPGMEAAFLALGQHPVFQAAIEVSDDMRALDTFSFFGSEEWLAHKGVVMLDPATCDDCD